ncbi:PTS transporter subunit IIC [Proteiniclasticum sp. C24MP]|uniref:PTS transporter subunit IIC n=1 Tax=Proteiniclasticum sp. C24MP TaxID=3374101 RepID=UPI0037541C26
MTKVNKKDRTDSERKKITNYAVRVLNGMAQGLFASLLIGLIIKQLGTLLNIEVLILFGSMAQSLMGPAIGAAVAYSVGAPPLGIFASVIVGAIGAGTFTSVDGAMVARIGEPVGALIASLVSAELTKFLSGKTKIEIVLLPLAAIVAGGLVGYYISPFIAAFMTFLGSLINRATELQPIPMGIIVSTSMGMVLTLPISSAALSVSLGLSGIAAGASTVGCATQMVGFAVASFRENGFGGLVSQGIGTSMLQISNIIKNPKIWIPPTMASAILGPIASAVFKMEGSKLGAGMGTSGLVGQFDAVSVMGSSTETILLIILMHVILPAILTLIISEIMRKKGHIKFGDMKL